MADSKKSSLLQAANKLKAAKKNISSSSNDSKGIKNKNAAGGALKDKIRDTVSKFERDN